VATGYSRHVTQADRNNPMTDFIRIASLLRTWDRFVVRSSDRGEGGGEARGNALNKTRTRTRTPAAVDLGYGVYFCAALSLELDAQRLRYSRLGAAFRAFTCRKHARVAVGSSDSSLRFYGSQEKHIQAAARLAQLSRFSSERDA